jgi:DNA-binding NarL/FixJ family response regulator
MLSTFPTRGTFGESLERGAKGYLLKSVGTEELLEAIRAVYRGSPVLRAARLPPRAKPRVVDRGPKTPRPCWRP